MALLWNMLKEYAEDIKAPFELKENNERTKRIVWSHTLVQFRTMWMKPFFGPSNRTSYPKTQSVGMNSSVMPRRGYLAARANLPFNHNGDTRIRLNHNVTITTVVAGQPITKVYFKQLIEGKWTSCTRTSCGSGPHASVFVDCDDGLRHPFKSVNYRSSKHCNHLSHEQYVKGIIANVHATANQTAVDTAPRTVSRWRPHHGPRPHQTHGKNGSTNIGGEVHNLPRAISNSHYEDGSYPASTIALLIFLFLLLVALIFAMQRTVRRCRKASSQLVTANKLTRMRAMRRAEKYLDLAGEEEKDVGFVDVVGEMETPN